MGYGGWGCERFEILGTTATLFTLSVPTGIKVNALYQFAATSGDDILITSPDEITVAQNVPVGNITANNSVASGSGGNTRTNASSQIRAVANTSSIIFQLATYGWIDTRGKFN